MTFAWLEIEFGTIACTVDDFRITLFGLVFLLSLILLVNRSTIPAELDIAFTTGSGHGAPGRGRGEAGRGLQRSLRPTTNDWWFIAKLYDLIIYNRIAQSIEQVNRHYAPLELTTLCFKHFIDYFDKLYGWHVDDLLVMYGLGAIKSDVYISDGRHIISSFTNGLYHTPVIRTLRWRVRPN